MLIIIPVPEISNIQVYIGYYISASTTHFFKMSVSSEDVTHVQLFNDMMSKFGEFHFSFFLCCHDSIFSENEESPPFVGYDPSHPTVFFTILKWYDDPEKAAEQLIELYPPHLSPTSPSLPLSPLSLSFSLPFLR